MSEENNGAERPIRDKIVNIEMYFFYFSAILWTIYFVKLRWGSFSAHLKTSLVLLALAADP
jgi:hypothetical protein